MAKTTRTTLKRSTDKPLFAFLNSSGEQHPWAWILLALNPLFIVNGIHTIDFYIKAIWISLIMVLAFLFNKSPKDRRDGLEFNVIDLFFLGYMIWGALALSWSVVPVLGFERLVYLCYPIGGYILGRQTKFWNSTLFWNVFTGTAFIVGLLGVTMWIWGGDPNGVAGKTFSQMTFKQIIGCDWIMSAGRPSSTLSYRAYAGTYMAMTLPFLLWYMFSSHIKSGKHFAFVGISFVLLFEFLIYSRARSGWMGVAAALPVMGVVYLWQKVIIEKSWKIVDSLICFGGIIGAAIIIKIFKAVMPDSAPIIFGLLSIVGLGSIIAFGIMQKGNWREKWYIGGALVFATCAIMTMLPANPELLKGDQNPQRLEGTGKETLGSAVSTLGALLQSGNSDRLAFWKMSHDMVFNETPGAEYRTPFGLPRWVFGVGIGQFPIYVPLHSDILHSLGAEIHNDWIQSFTELGPLGLFFYAGTMLVFLFYSLKNRHKGLMIACVGGVMAWVFSTMSDFLVPRIYGALWVGGIAAIVCGEAELKAAITIAKLHWQPWLRKVAAVFFFWLGAAYFITLWCDRQIYTALVYGKPAVDVLVNSIFPSSTWWSYRWGVGKYLIFSPITDLSRAVAKQGKTAGNEQIIDNVQKTIAQEVLDMHPTNYNAMALLVDINFKEKNYKEALKYNDAFLKIRPKDQNMWLFKSQTALALGDSLNGAKACYEALKIAPDVLLNQQFWQTRFSETLRNQVAGNDSTIAH